MYVLGSLVPSCFRLYPIVFDYFRLCLFVSPGQPGSASGGLAEPGPARPVLAEPGAARPPPLRLPRMALEQLVTVMDPENLLQLVAGSSGSSDFISRKSVFQVPVFRVPCS